ncbi:putative reverse transcriptase domain-containing protein [Tanacetum coccineum]
MSLTSFVKANIVLIGSLSPGSILANLSKLIVQLRFSIDLIVIHNQPEAFDMSQIAFAFNVLIDELVDIFCKEQSSSVDHLRLRWEIYFVVLADAAESIRNTTRKCTAYHPQIDGQSEHEIRTLEGMLRACVIDYGGRLGVYLPLVELSYNNSYHSSIQYALFGALYGRKLLIKERFKAVSPWKGVICFGKKGKLALRYVKPFEILEMIGFIDYRLRLPEELSSVHDTFHVSNLEKKYLADANQHVSLDEIEADKTLRFVEEPKGIMDREF